MRTHLNTRTPAEANHSSVSIPFFQPKLSVNQPDDAYEQEADAMADKVMRMPDATANNNAFFRPSLPYIQRKCAHCEEDEREMQRKESSSEAIEATVQTEDYINHLSGGRTLSNEERSFFEPRIGYDFGNVKIHTDALAAKSAQSINAMAYTSANHIVFGAGQYAPETDSGKRLLGHELTHVVQQDNRIGRSIQRTPEISDAFKLAFGAIVSPGALALKGLLATLDLLPASERDVVIKKIISKIISSLESIREPPDVLKKAISSMMPMPGLDPTTLWPLMISGMVGFYKHLDTKNGDELFSLIKQAVDAQLNPLFYAGAIWGMVQGIGKWFKDMFDLVVLLGEIGVYMTVPPLFVYVYSDEIKKAWEAAGAAGKWISDNKESLFELLKDKEALMALQSLAKDVIYGIAESLGDKAAEEMIKTVNEGAFAMGEAGGKIFGYFIPDIILAVGTDGISGVLKGVQGIFKSVKAAVMTIEEVAIVLKSIEKVLDGVKAMKIFAKGSKLNEMGGKLIELFNELIKFFKGFKNAHEDLVKKIIAIAKKKGMPIDAGVDKMYNIANLEKGLMHADFLKSKSFRESIHILLDESHADWKKVYQSITYAAQKGRFAEFDIIFDAIVKGKTLAIPRAFKTAEDFVEFSKDMRSILTKYGTDIQIQGSSTMNLSSKLKDIDIAIFSDETGFINSMKKVWAKQFAEYYKLGSVPDAAAIDTKTFLQFLEEAEKAGKGNVAANGVKITGEMESAILARKNGKIFGSKLMTSAEKKIRDAWIARLGLEDIDISLIMKGKAFDVGPFISLTK